ncbi:AIR carboxylase family protein, partial [Nguyenibacter vanlangensis]
MSPPPESQAPSEPASAALAARVGIIMGSQSDWETMRHAATVLEALDVAHEVRIVSAHRTPDRLADYARGAAGRGLSVIIA